MDNNAEGNAQVPVNPTIKPATSDLLPEANSKSTIPDTASFLNNLGIHTSPETTEQRQARLIQEAASQYSQMSEADKLNFGKTMKPRLDERFGIAEKKSEVPINDAIKPETLAAAVKEIAAEQPKTESRPTNETADFLNNIGEHTTHPSAAETEIKNNQELFKTFKEKLEKNNIRYANIGGIFILPSAVPSPDGSKKLLIGFDEKTGPIQIDSGVNMTVEKLIQGKTKLSPERQKEIAEAIKKFNSNREPNLQLSEGLTEIAGQKELLVWDGTLMRPIPITLRPDEALIDSAIQSGIKYSEKETAEEQKMAEIRNKYSSYGNQVKGVLNKY